MKLTTVRPSMKTKSSPALETRTKPYMFRLDPKEPREAELLERLQRASVETALSKNHLVILAAAAGLPQVVTNINELHNPKGEKAAA